jgi:hypothetical protein
MDFDHHCLEQASATFSLTMGCIGYSYLCQGPGGRKGNKVVGNETICNLKCFTSIGIRLKTIAVFLS